MKDFVREIEHDIYVKENGWLDPLKKAQAEESAKKMLHALRKALEAGNYNAAPTTLKQGCGYTVEDISEVKFGYNEASISMKITLPTPLTFVKMDFIVD